MYNHVRILRLALLQRRSKGDGHSVFETDVEIQQRQSTVIHLIGTKVAHKQAARVRPIHFRHFSAQV